MKLKFQLKKTLPDSRARLGELSIRGKTVETPIFMPVATTATVRNQPWESVNDTGSQFLLANTYHLFLRPGLEAFEHFGGIHKFMNWKGGVITDSGGFQIFSLENARTISEDGVAFRSYVDKSWVKMTPESCMKIQTTIGSDIRMVLDHCVPSTSPREVVKDSVDRTLRWAKRCYAARGEGDQAMFGIVQGACFPELRRESAEALTQIPFEGFAIGGLAVGETKPEREDMTEFTESFLPKDKPRYLMGVGTPIDLLEAVHRGVDLFDCILPTSLAQQGVAYTSRGKVDLKRGVHKLSDAKLDPNCSCPTCTQYSRGYLYHLAKAGELLLWQLVGRHNLNFYHTLMTEIRNEIRNGTFASYYQRMRPELSKHDEDHPAKQPVKKKKKSGPSISRGNFTLFENEQGMATIVHKNSGESMHRKDNPYEEVYSLYIEQTGLKEKLLEKTNKPLVIWDVGLGAAFNAMAVLNTVEKLLEVLPAHLIRPVELVSFENDLDALRLALDHSKKMQHLHHKAPHTLLGKRSYSASCFHWTLHEGDFLRKMVEATDPDIILYDPFSYKTDGELWKLSTFEILAKRLGGVSAEIYTYSASTAVRAALLSAGFFVAQGAATGEKRETSIALTPLRAKSPHSFSLLGAEWIARWKRSDRKTPFGVDENDKFENENRSQKIISHEQFQVTE